MGRASISVARSRPFRTVMQPEERFTTAPICRSRGSKALSPCRVGRDSPSTANALPAHGPGAEEKGGGGPIPLHSEMGGKPVALAAGDPIAAACPVQGDARCSQDLLGHGDIWGGLRRGGEGEGTVSRQQR